jgi:NAD(P)-dependent dehydrogenase (short-subunit alcohol dehydrogenase family)
VPSNLAHYPCSLGLTGCVSKRRNPRRGTSFWLAATLPAQRLLSNFYVKEAGEHGTGVQIETMALDLGSLKSIRKFAHEVRSLGPPVHRLICNAGMQAGSSKSFTADGFEATFGVNHLGHFLLVNLMIPLLSTSARVLVVASGVHDPAQKTGVPAPAWNEPEALARGELGSAAANDKPSAAGGRLFHFQTGEHLSHV